jgi:hypothetical protein
MTTNNFFFGKNINEQNTFSVKNKPSNVRLSVIDEWRNVNYRSNENQKDKISLQFEKFNKDWNKNLEISFERIQ